MDFKLEDYARFLDSAKQAGWQFKPLVEFKKFGREEKTIYLRHDVDYHIGYAAIMSDVERVFGVRSTYHFLVTSPFYNFFDDTFSDQLKIILNGNHEIGLHISEHSILSPTTQGRIINHVIDLQTCSTHKPTKTKSHFDVHLTLNNCPNAYTFDLPYCSDSSMRWQDKTPEQMIEQGQSFQLLIHPIWWVAQGNTREEKLASTVQKTLSRIGQAFIADANDMAKVLGAKNELSTD